MLGKNLEIYEVKKMMKAEEKIILGRYEFWNVESNNRCSRRNVLNDDCKMCGCSTGCSCSIGCGGGSGPGCGCSAPG